MKKATLLLGAALLVAVPSQSQAQFGGPDSENLCHATDLAGVTVLGCYGFFSGNQNNGSPAGKANQKIALDFLLGGDNTPSILEQNNYADGTSVLNFSNTMFGITIVAFHWGGGNGYTGNSTAFYKIDAGAAGINSITLNKSPDETVLMSKAISNGALYYTGGPSTTVPEPATYVLMASGLAALGVFARRRQKNS